MQSKIEQEQKASLSTEDENYQQWIAQTSFRDMTQAIKSICTGADPKEQNRLEFLGKAYKNKLDTVQGLNGKAVSAKHTVDMCVISVKAGASYMLQGYMQDLTLITNQIEPQVKKKPWYMFGNKR